MGRENHSWLDSRFHFSFTYLDSGKNISMPVSSGRQAYLVLIEGSSDVNGQNLKMRDSMKITEEVINIIAIENAHIIVFEMTKS